jgi:hypothetical protein
VPVFKFNGQLRCFVSGVLARDSEKGAKQMTLRMGSRLAEDSFDSQQLIVDVLAKAGAEVPVAEDGELAVDSALAAEQTGSASDIILMDIHRCRSWMAAKQLDNCGKQDMPTRSLR